jgi:hypothetical protein
MPKFQFVPLGGASNLQEVHHDHTSIGIVWQRGGLWHGHPDSMETPLLSSEDRDTAAELLLAAAGLHRAA